MAFEPNTSGKKLFEIGDRVRVNNDGDWIDYPTGTIRGLPKEQKVKSDSDYAYYVVFDKPAQDKEGYGPYSGGMILSRYLDLAN